MLNWSFVDRNILLGARAYTAVDFDLWKNVVHVAISDEVRKKAAHDILGLHVSDAARDLARMENKQIDEAMDGATDVAGSDWGGANNPYEDINPVITTIEGNGYPVDAIVAHPLVWGDFFSNDDVKGTLVGQRMPGARTFPVPRTRELPVNEVKEEKWKYFRTAWSWRRGRCGAGSPGSSPRGS